MEGGGELTLKWNECWQICHWKGAMKSILANLWHPHGVTISDLSEKRFMFKFYYEIDFDRFLEGSPWTFNGHLLVFHSVRKGEDPMVVPLIFVDFWVQIHNLPFGLILEVMGRQFGNFIGTFLEYDMKAMGRGFRGYMRVSVQVDIRDPLKRCNKII
ncbi:hypothetical protein Gotri_022922 [Gossypium trilobum]|uniref:DUF4283 domain-containing protein n=1 Tax=Gossypium trilobum TaxID=34281 RepID=A0A7J9DHN6_9ROSI|nr:hypothetical protein [Gossypium trilobum]